MEKRPKSVRAGVTDQLAYQTEPPISKDQGILNRARWDKFHAKCATTNTVIFDPGCT